MKKIIIEKEKVLHGDEKEVFYSSFVINIEGNVIEIKGKYFYDNPLRLLKSEISDETFKQVTQDFLLKKSIIEDYVDKETELPIYYYFDKTYIILFGFGELNPNHFVVNLVGIWKIK